MHPQLMEEGKQKGQPPDENDTRRLPLAFQIFSASAGLTVTLNSARQTVLFIV